MIEIEMNLQFVFAKSHCGKFFVGSNDNINKLSLECYPPPPGGAKLVLNIFPMFVYFCIYFPDFRTFGFFFFYIQKLYVLVFFDPFIFFHFISLVLFIK